MIFTSIIIFFIFGYKLIKIKYNKMGKKRKMVMMERIDENSLFIENKQKYNEYNQINIMDKLHEIYVIIIKFLLKIE